MTADHDHISDLRWDRLFAGELGTADRDAVRTHADGCARCSARMRELEAERAAFTLRPPIVELRRARRTWTWLAPLAGAVAAAAVVAIVLVRRPPDEPGERPKGAAVKLHLLTGSPDALQPVASGDRLRPGNYLQAGYTAKVDGFGVVLSIDGAGQANAYVPSRGDAMVALPAGSDRSFPESTVLDDVVGTERIAIVWCESALPIAPLLAELRASQTIADRDGCVIRVVTLDKTR